MSQRILVTGASGFIGRALIDHLENFDCEIAAVTRGRLSRVGSRCSVMMWNEVPDDLIRQVIDFRPDIVYHLATHFVAQHESCEIPRLIDSNVTFGTLILEASNTVGARVVITGSSWQHFAGAPYHPVSLYAASKQALLDIAVFYAGAGLDVRELTLFDTYGPGDSRGKIVSRLLESAASGQPVDMSSGNQLIDLLYVTDVVDALLVAAELSSLTTMGVQRFVAQSGTPVTIRELVQYVEATVGRSIATQWGKRPDRPNEMTSPWLLENALPDWTPAVSLPNGLRRCWDAMIESEAT